MSDISNHIVRTHLSRKYHKWMPLTGWNTIFQNRLTGKIGGWFIFQKATKIRPINTRKSALPKGRNYVWDVLNYLKCSFPHLKCSFWLKRKVFWSDGNGFSKKWKKCACFGWRSYIIGAGVVRTNVSANIVQRCAMTEGRAVTSFAHAARRRMKRIFLHCGPNNSI